MLKVVNQHNDIIAFLETDEHIPAWLAYYRDQQQAELDTCRKINANVNLPDKVSICKDGNTIIFIGIFTEYIQFEAVEPWKKDLPTKEKKKCSS